MEAVTRLTAAGTPGAIGVAGMGRLRGTAVTAGGTTGVMAAGRASGTAGTGAVGLTATAASPSRVEATGPAGTLPTEPLLLQESLLADGVVLVGWSGL
jgi:hypothetical protein